MRRTLTLFACLALSACATAAQHFQKEPPTPCERAMAALSDVRAFEAFARGTGNVAVVAAAVATVAAAEEVARTRCEPATGV